jgi:hypothetical protein
MRFQLGCVDLHVDRHITRPEEGSIGFSTRAGAASCLTGQDLGYSMAASKQSMLCL